MKTTSAFINPNQSVWFYCQTLICGTRKKPILTISNYLLAIALILSFPSYAQYPNMGEKHERRTTYEKRTTYQGDGPYQKDPHIWVYTSNFADRFGMPKKWINDELKGAEALAYKVRYDRGTSCGFFRDKENCSQDYMCNLDIYMSAEDSAKLPWYDDNPVNYRRRQFDRSTGFMFSQYKKDNKYFRKQIKEWGLNGYSMQSFFNSNGKLGYSQGIGLIEYRKQIYPNLDYLSFNTGCGINEDPSNDMKFVLYFRSKKESRYRDIHSLAKSIHLIEIPISFHKRISSYKKDNHEKRSIWYKVKKELQKGAK